MASITYTAKRKIMAGHTAGFSYSMDVGMTGADWSYDTNRYDNKSLGGVRQSYLAAIEETYDLTLLPVMERSAEHLQIREFIASVIGGESFTFDRFGTVADPDDPVEYLMDNKTVKEKRDGVNYIGYTIKIYQRLTP